MSACKILTALLLVALIVDSSHAGVHKKKPPLGKKLPSDITDKLQQNKESKEQEIIISENSSPITETFVTTNPEEKVVDNELEVKLDDNEIPSANRQLQAIIDAVPLFINNFLGNVGTEQKVMSVVQVLFYHILGLSILYLLQTLILGFGAFIDKLRSPLLIYKEVDGYKEVKAHPAPKYPEPHHDYGYTGGFKSTKGEKINFISFHKPKPVYHKPEPVYHKPEPVYHKPEPVYHKPEPVYHHENSGYGDPAPHSVIKLHNEPRQVYHKPEPVYHKPEPVYHKPEPVYHKPEPVYHKPEPVYQYEDSGYGDPAPHSVIKQHQESKKIDILHAVPDKNIEGKGSSYSSYSGQQLPGHNN